MSHWIENEKMFIGWLLLNAQESSRESCRKAAEQLGIELRGDRVILKDRDCINVMSCVACLLEDDSAIDAVSVHEKGIELGLTIPYDFLAETTDSVV